MFTLRMSLAVVLALPLASCSQFVANQSGTAPIGVVQGERTLAQIVTDNSIAKTADINMYKLDPRFNFSRVNVSSFHSVVLLTGQVPDSYLKQLAEQNVRAMSDVKDVHNYISVGEKLDYNAIVKDGVTTANIRAQILRQQGLSTTRIKVVTEAGVVYAMGRLTPIENQLLMQILQNTQGIAKIVSLIDFLPADGSRPLVLMPAPRTPLAASPVTPVDTPASVQASVVVTPLALDVDNNVQPQ